LTVGCEHVDPLIWDLDRSRFFDQVFDVVDDTPHILKEAAVELFMAVLSRGPRSSARFRRLMQLRGMVELLFTNGVPDDDRYVRRDASGVSTT
jgi:hypothetical protein